MIEEKTLLPDGYKPVKDRSKFSGKTLKLSPAQEEIRRLMVADERLKNEDDINRSSKPQIGKLKRLSDIISNNVQAQTDLRSITPYIKRAEQIWLTLLLKPNGLDQEILNFDTIDSPIKNAKLHKELLQRIKTYFTTVYPFEETLPDIIKDVMFRTGSYALLNLSHSALDHLINGMNVSGAESLKNEVLETTKIIKRQHFVGDSFSRAKNIGWIRKTKSEDFTGFESIYSNTDKGEEFDLVHPDLKWTFTDNTVVLKVSELRNKIVEDRLKAAAGTESLENLVNLSFEKTNKPHKVNNNNVGIIEKETYRELLERTYTERNWKQKESLFIRKEQYYTGSGKGVPLIYHVPSEACIPVYLNGDRTKPIGYILLTDPKTGEFLKTTSDVKFYSSNKNRKEKVDTLNKAGSLNNIITNIKNIANGKDCDIDMDWAVDMVNGLLEKEIIESFLNGERAAPVSITLTDANKKLYLSRALKQQGVRSIFAPASTLTYFALDYNNLGVGKSLIEEAKMIITRLAILDIADTVANLENAVSKTVLTIDLEEENFAPTELINEVRENYLLNNPSMLNFVGFSNVPIDRIIDGVKESLVRIKVNGGENKFIINPNIEESQEDRQGLQPVDNDSREKTLNSLASYFDLKRSWLEDSEQGNDFAIEALADQELLLNITVERSRFLSKFISEHFSKHIATNEALITELIEIIKENKKLYDKPDQGKRLADFVIGDDGTIIENDGAKNKGKKEEDVEEEEEDNKKEKKKGREDGMEAMEFDDIEKELNKGLNEGKSSKNKKNPKEKEFDDVEKELNKGLENPEDADEDKKTSKSDTKNKADKKNKKEEDKNKKDSKDEEDQDDLDERVKVNYVLKDFLNNLNVTLPLPTTVEQYNKLTDKLEAVDKLVAGWKEIGIAEKLLKRTLTDMDLESLGDEFEGTNSEYVMSLIDGVLRREAYINLGINIPFDEIVSDGKQGGLLAYVDEIAQQRENTVTFIDELFKRLSKDDPRITKIGERYQNGLLKKHLEKMDALEAEENEMILDETEMNDVDSVEADLNQNLEAEFNETTEESEEFNDTNSVDDVAASLDSNLNLGPNIT